MLAVKVHALRDRRAKAFVFLAVVIFLLAHPSCSVAQSSGLVAAYSFNEGSGTTVADSSGNGLTGTIVGATWTTGGRYGNALSFNGTSNYIDLGNPTALQLTGSMTLEAWINAAANPADDGQIIAKSSGIGWQLKTSPDTGPHTFGVKVSGNSSASTQRYSATVRSLNTWYHVAGVYNASTGTLDIYVNGVLNNGTLKGAIPAGQFNQSVNVNIGRRTGGYYFNGIIDEVRIYNRALSQTEIQIDMNTPVGGTPPPPDTTPPTVSITSPTDGATVAGTVSVTASASDNVGVAGVQFLLDNANLGNEVTSSPYTLQWNTSTTNVGVHTLIAIARDFSGNTASSTTISVTVTNPTGAQIGQWQSPISMPLVAVHMMLMPNGKILVFDGQENGQFSQVWDLATNTFTRVDAPINVFCSGHTILADGRVFVAGGHVAAHVGLSGTSIFNPQTQSWAVAPPMANARWYPTTTVLPDGRVVVLAGENGCDGCDVDMPQIYDPVTNSWSTLPNAVFAMPYYPHSFILPDGRVFVSSTSEAPIVSKVLDLNAQTWTAVGSTALDGGSAVMYRPGKILKSGTSANPDNTVRQSFSNAYVVDMTQPSPSWRQVASMAFPRTYATMVLLPDGNVFEEGGGQTTEAIDPSAAVLQAEIWSPTAETWTTVASMATPRLYHSTALLLPDGRVLVSGGGRFNTGTAPTDRFNAEYYLPPYLFKGPRPTIALAPSIVQYNQSFTVQTPDAAQIGSVVLMRLGEVTHTFNMSQNYVPLNFQVVTGGVQVQAPANSNFASPGYHMLFIVNSNGVPSVAAIVRLPAPSEDAQPPTAPSNLNAVPSVGSVSLTWSASTDNVGVTAYNVHRSSISGFIPATANKLGQTAATTYTDTSFSAPGTYYYLVTAQDAAGNVSSPSNQASVAAVPDTTPPTVSVTAPLSGATVAGIVTVTAAASDDVTVAGVQFLLDGAGLGAEVTGAGPTYNLAWPTTTAPNGPHTLSARARDGAGNTALAANVSVTVSNAAPSGLVAAYGFNEGSGTTVSDISGNNLTGTIVGATWTTGGRYGNALSFNGTSNYIDLGNPTALQLTGSMTLEAWINAAANPADDGQIIAKSSGIGWQLKTSPDTGPHTFGVKVSGNSSASTQRYSATVRSLNTWYHVAGVYNASTGTLDIYVNGVLNNGTLKGAIPAGQFNQSVNVNIGRRTGGYYFNGIIDEVRIYNRALSQTEIQIDMNTPVGGTPPPPDTTPPSAPSNLTATASSSAQINLSWTASTDNVGVTGYLVERCQGTACSNFAQVGMPSGTSFTDLALTPATSYSYRVRATDAAGNLSPYSTVASTTTQTASSPVFSAETHSATDGIGLQFNNATLFLNVSGTNTLLIAAWHSEWDGGPNPVPTPPSPESWSVSCNGVPGTVITETNGYKGVDGNRRFRIYYWLNPTPGTNTIVVSNPNTGPNELSVSAILLTNVSQTGPLGTIALDVSTTARTGETETVGTSTSDLVLHVIADALFTRGTLGPGETSRSIANDGGHTSPGNGDASLWLSTKPGELSSTTVSSSGWASRTINGVAIVIHGVQ